MTKKNKFCVITTQRSGSTWLSTLLDSHPKIKAFEEPFIWRKERPNWKEEKFPTYYNYKNNISTNHLFTLFKYLDQLDKYDNGKKIELIGFKIMYNQIIENPEILIKLIQDQYKIIHLVRQNYLDILISKAVHEQYGLFHSNKTQLNANQIFLDVKILMKNLKKCDRNYKIFSTLLKLMPLSVLEINYESLVDDENIILSSVANFLQVDNQSITFKSNLKKVNQGRYEEKIINYTQVINAIKDSKYAKFIL